MTDEKLQELKELSDGNNNLIIDLLGKFKQNADRYLGKSREALKSADYEQVQFALHTLKGSALSLGLIELGSLLTNLNQRARNGDFLDFEQEIDRIENLVKEVEKFRETLS